LLQNMNSSRFTGTLTHKIVPDRDLKPKRLRNTELEHALFFTREPY
jgi:hypothetical protein